MVRSTSCSHQYGEKLSALKHETPRLFSRRVLSIQQPTTVRIVARNAKLRKALQTRPVEEPASSDRQRLKSFGLLVNPEGCFLQKEEAFSYLRDPFHAESVKILEESHLTAL